MAATRRELFSGEVLFQQGDPSECAWLIESGMICLAFEHAGERIAYGELGPGELLGELGMLEGTPRSAIAIARGDTVLLSIDHDQFLERLHKSDPIVRALVGGLRRRTRSLLAALPDDVIVPAEDLRCDDAEERTGTDKIRLETQLREALSENALRVCYQPVFDLHCARVSG